MHTRDEWMNEFRYDRETGHFWFLKKRQGRVMSKPAGSMQGDGYWELRWDGERQLAHRLAWLFETGDWPVFEIDHIDRVPWHNWIKNLQDVTHAINMKNQKAHADKQSNLPRGIDLRRGGYRVRVTINGTRYERENILTLEAAIALRFNWEQQ